MTLPAISIEGVKRSHFWGMMTAEQQVECEKIVAALSEAQIRVPDSDFWALQWEFGKGYDLVSVTLAPWSRGFWCLQIVARETSDGARPSDKFMFIDIVHDAVYECNENGVPRLIGDFIRVTQELTKGTKGATNAELHD